ncbi:MAG: 16S rRNA (guanine(527)-N(7))-methyltransferase RsmG [Bryobacteraceae bacterium]|jgi:16S rRNA (guanine(527)-N(7))-methyltransferase RsmG
MNETAEFAAILARSFSPFRRLSPDLLSELLRHYELLLRWNKHLNLTSIAGLEETVLRHYCESLFVGIQLPEARVSVLDVGSGAGFPGIPMAVLRPDCRFTLAESHQRKAVFLREATRHFSNVRIAGCRAVDVEGAFDWVVSRAVKWPAVLKTALRLCRREGVGLDSADLRDRSLTGHAGLSLGLLLGLDDAADVVRQPLFDWRQPIPLPSGHRRVLLLGQARPA